LLLAIRHCFHVADFRFRHASCCFSSLFAFLSLISSPLIIFTLMPCHCWCWYWLILLLLLIFAFRWRLLLFTLFAAIFLRLAALFSFAIISPCCCHMILRICCAASCFSFFLFAFLSLLFRFSFLSPSPLPCRQHHHHTTIPRHYHY